jgi:hypothetical protein
MKRLVRVCGLFVILIYWYSLFNWPEFLFDRLGVGLLGLITVVAWLLSSVLLAVPLSKGEKVKWGWVMGLAFVFGFYPIGIWGWPRLMDALGLDHPVFTALGIPLWAGLFLAIAWSPWAMKRDQEGSDDLTPVDGS